MSSTITGLDHVGVLGWQLPPLVAAYERLGFLATPTARHQGEVPGVAGADSTALWASGNRCAMLERGYLELLGLVSADGYADFVTELLKRYVGAHVIALRCTDANAECERLIDAGFRAAHVSRLERPIDGGPNGRNGVARFTLVRPEPGPLPEGQIFLIQHETPELLWQPQWLNHPNTAVSVDEVFIATADMSASLGRLERLTGQSAMRDGRARRLSPGHGAIVLYSGEDAQPPIGSSAQPPVLPRVVGVTIGVRDLDICAALLERNGVAFDGSSSAVTVSPAEAGGAVCRFVVAA